MRDRVAQMAAAIVLEPIFEADFRPSSYGFQPKRCATQALEALRVQGARGGNRAISTDILDFAREFSSFRRQGAATGERR